MRCLQFVLLEKLRKVNNTLCKVVIHFSISEGIMQTHNIKISHDPFHPSFNDFLTWGKKLLFFLVYVIYETMWVFYRGF